MRDDSQDKGADVSVHREVPLRRVTLTLYVVLLTGFLFGPHVCPEHGVVFHHPWGIVTPISFAPGRFSIRDVILNLGAFFLLAVFMHRAHVPSSGGTMARVLAAGTVALVLSTGAELFQQYLPGRLPAIQDIVVDVIGALLGAVVMTTRFNETGTKGDARDRVRGTGPASHHRRSHRPEEKS